MSTVKITFLWTTYKPDARAYKQQSIELQPLVQKIAIDMPVNLLVNSEEVLLAELSNSTMPEYILSLDGVKYLVDQWEKVFSDATVEEEFFNKIKEEATDWSDTETMEDWETATSENETTEDNDDWGEPENETSDAPWEDDWNE